MPDDTQAPVQRAKPRRERRKDFRAVNTQGSVAGSAPLDAWGWAERISVIGLFTLAAGYALFAMQAIIIPVVTAWVMGAILRPIVEWAERMGVPRSIAVIVTALVALLILLVIIGFLSTPFAYWIGRTAELAALIKEKLQLLSQPLAIFDEISKALSEVSGSPAHATATNYDTSTIISGIISALTPIVTEFMLFFFAMIFWMIYANDIKAGIAYLFSGDRARKEARAVMDEAENGVSEYFGTLILINMCLAAIAAGIAAAVGLSNPLLWGVLAGTLSFIPYLGPAIMVATLFVIGLMTFPTFTDALVPPILWIAVTTVEGQFVTPTIIGHRHTLNPFLVFLSIAFWTWMWGPVGAFLAVPLLISADVLQRHLSSYSATRAT